MSGGFSISGTYGLILLWVIIAIVVVALVVFLVIRKNKSNKSQAERVCPKCGKAVSKDKNFCMSCGTKIE